MNTLPLPTLFISHGGGPWPWMQDQMNGRYDKLAAALRAMPEQVGTRPDSILMVSAHWEESVPTVMTNPKPPMLYDYYNFPEYTYQVHYDAPGAPGLASRVRTLLADAGIASAEDAKRGFDHGMFSPMTVSFPAAEIPVCQLSLREGLDPAEHLAIGRALAPLRHEGVLIIGSGLSYHNLRLFGPGGRAPSAAFDAWLHDTLAIASPAERSEALTRWEASPSARVAHPREEHLLPLMVAVGAAEGEVASRTYYQQDFGDALTVSSYQFGQGR